MLQEFSKCVSNLKRPDVWVKKWREWAGTDPLPWEHKAQKSVKI